MHKENTIGYLHIKFGELFRSNKILKVKNPTLKLKIVLKQLKIYTISIQYVIVR